MQKKSISPIPKPSAEEISVSKYCTQVIKSFESFQNSDNSDLKIVNFQTFIKDLNDFIKNEKNLNLIRYYSIPMLKEAMKCLSNSFQKENAILLFNSLEKILSIKINIDFDDISAFILSLISNTESIEILKNYVHVLETLFSDEDFFSNFVNHQYVSEFFEKSFINFISVDSCFLFRHLICEISPKQIRNKINLSKILEFLLTIINPEIQVEYSISLSKLVSTSIRHRLFLNNNQSFILFSDYIHSASSTIIIDCFNDLVFTPPINLNILSNIILFYQKYPQHQKSLFNWIFDDIIINHINMLYEINNTIPYFSWITLTTPISEVIKAISILSQYDISFASPFISPLFALLNKGGSSFEEYQSTIQIIENQILLRQISLSFLANSLFLKTFIINVQIDILGQLFEKVYTFAQLVYDIYTLRQSVPLRAQVITKLIQMVGKFPKNAHFISIFLVVSNSKKNISDLMGTIIESKNGELCTALGDSFAKSDSVVKYFINGNGIEWLDRVYNMKIVNLRQFIFLLNSLTRNSFIKEIDRYIESLPRDHPIFSIKQDDLVTLCYGYDGANHYFPLKIMSLFPLLETPQKVDPFNAYMIGKYAIDKFPNMADLPYFPEVANRYINDKTFQKIIGISAKRLESFCNPNFDHFPLFQVYEFLDDNIFDVKFKAISFWFKFGDTIRSELKIPFFHADKLQLFVKDQQLIANYEGVEYDADVKPLHWNNVIVVVTSQKVSHYVEVYVNLNKAVFISSRELNVMPSFEFSTYSAFLFIGAAIRIYQDDSINSDTETIFKNGPSFLGRLNESFIITPFAKGYLNPGKNVLAVKYRGFPVHFLSRKKMSLLYDRMANQKCTENEFKLLVSACFKIYSMLRNSLHDFFRSILTVYSKKKEFVNLELLSETLNFISKYKSKNEIIETIIGHKQFWSSIPSDMIIISLSSAFDNFNFYKEKENLEIFFAVEAYFNCGNPKLFMDLVYSSKNCQSYIHELFTGSHFIDNTQDKFTQCYLKSASTSQQNSNDEYTNDNSNSNDSNCASIQCNLPNDSLYPSNFDLICAFQTIKATQFQKAFANLLKQLIVTTQNISFVPLDGVYSLFLTSDTEIKAALYPALLNCEKIVPNSILFDSSFLSCVPQLFKYKEVWTETFNLLRHDSNEITKPSLLPVLFSLLWGYTVASIHSIASTGKTVIQKEDHQIEITKIINFLLIENNIKIVSNDKNVQKFIASWFPFILGYKPHKTAKDIIKYHGSVFLDEGLETQSFKLNGIEVISPSSFCFISMIWRKVIQESNLPIKTNDEYYKELQPFIVSSPVFNLYFNLIFSLSESHFNEILGAFLSVPLVSEDDELSKCYVCDFMHSLLNIVAESYTLTMNISSIFPFVHFMCVSGHITAKYLPTIVSDLFLISSVIDVVYKPSFNKLVPHLNNLLLNLFLTSLKICINRKDDQENNKNMINILYQVLLQQVHFLAQIASESLNEIEFYLMFFQQSLRFCTKIDIYNAVITEFGNSLNIVSNPQFQSLITSNNIENSNSWDVEMSKWEEFINSKILPIVNQSGIHHLSFSNIKECSKSFTSSFLNALQKQHQVADELPELFSKAKSFQDSKVDWTKTLHDIYQTTNDNFYNDSKLIIKTVTSQPKEETNLKKVLMPFMMPLRIPRLFAYVPTAISDFDNNCSEDILHFIDEMNLYKQPIENLSDLTHQIKRSISSFDEKTDIFQCEVKRLSETIQSILIVLSRDILILPFCKLNHNSSKSAQPSNPPLQPSEVAQFVKEVVCGMWGYSTLYMGRIVIRIPINSVLLVNQIDNNSVVIWSVSSGHFMINSIVGDMTKFISKFNDRKNFPLYSSLRIPTLEKLIISWENSRISNSQLILGINVFNHRVFCDQENFPIFPEDATIYGVNYPINESLSKNFCNTNLAGQIAFSNTIEESLSKTTSFIADKFMLNFNVKDRKVSLPLFDSSKKFFSQKLNTEKLNDGNLLDFNYKSSPNKLILNLPLLSVRISDEHDSIFLVIDKERLSLSMYDYSAQKVICEERSSLLASAKTLCVSENRFFFSIDFKSNITCIYQILYSNWSPTSFKFIRDISFGMRQSTSISGIDWVAATSISNRLVIWHFFPSTIHRIVEFDDHVKFAKFDENSGTVWVVSAKPKKQPKDEALTQGDDSGKPIETITFTLIGVNGEIFASESLHFESESSIGTRVTAFQVVPQPISVNVREAVCGFSDGSLHFISIESIGSNSKSCDVKITKLNSPHERPIKRIILHPCTPFFVTVDSSNNAYFWSQRSEDKQVLELSAFESCASCGGEAVSGHCRFCGRAFCRNCVNSEKVCNECLEK